jgi:hypothetical protein
VVASEPGVEFSWVVGTAEKHPMSWGYRLAPAGGGTDLTEFYDLAETFTLNLYWSLFGKARGRTNARNMQTTLERIKAAAEDTET